MFLTIFILQGLSEEHLWDVSSLDKKHYSSLFLYLYWNIVIIIIILSLNMRKSDMKMFKNKINKYTPSWHHHASERIYTYLCSVSLDDQLDIYHRSIRQTVGPGLHGSHLPFKINGLTGVTVSDELDFYILQTSSSEDFFIADILIPFNLQNVSAMTLLDCSNLPNLMIMEVSLPYIDVDRRQFL